ncbi:sulfite exporter TauE/SafE family protein [Flavobacteriaceae bacterium]|nr:sulfite exporter TauE/SafE family protein [Flavobacteriaceae bacterium]MDC6469380.1 sulfite exporter TauE/SafE family protein [Flavobacteriaceae bacterium]
MEEYIQAVILIVVGFFAGVINTLAGGGSLFTLPVLIFLGLPPNIANGTNRIAIVIQSLSGALGYKSKGISNFPFNIYLGISASIGAVIGAQIAIDLDGRLFNRILAIILIVVGGLILMNAKNLTHKLPKRLTGKYLLFGIIGFFFIGIYGGFINAGIGIVIMLFLNRINRLSLVKTNASKTAIVFIYSSLALAVFAFNDAIDWKLGLLMALGTSVGAWWASRWSVKKGDQVIRWAMLITIGIMAVKLWFFE